MKSKSKWKNAPKYLLEIISQYYDKSLKNIFNFSNNKHSLHKTNVTNRSSVESDRRTHISEEDSLDNIYTSKTGGEKYRIYRFINLYFYTFILLYIYLFMHFFIHSFLCQVINCIACPKIGRKHRFIMTWTSTVRT